MMTSRRTLEQARDALRQARIAMTNATPDSEAKESYDWVFASLDKPIAAIEAELAKPDEPAVDDNRTAPLYLKTAEAPPRGDLWVSESRTEPVALTDERIDAVLKELPQVFFALTDKDLTIGDYKKAMRIAARSFILAAAVPSGHVVVPVALVDASKQALNMMIRCNTPFSTEYDEAMTALGDALAARPKP